MRVVLAEKPSVAADIAAVVGARSRRAGYFEGGGYQVSWALGHLVEFSRPEGMRAEWKSWRPELLPMLPERWVLAPREGVGKQLAVVRKLLRAKGTAEVIAATDAGREGELIWRLIAEYCGCRKPTRRLWISSLTPESIRRGLANLRPATDFDGLHEAARARAQADWLVGLNLTRAYSVTTRGDRTVVSVGRVQTPTLAMVVARDAHIEAFEPVAYREVVGRFTSEGSEALDATYVRRGCDVLTGDETKDTTRLPMNAGGDPLLDAALIAARLASGAARIAAVRRQSRTTRPPLLFDLTELQREANRMWGWSASETLATAQTLYERHKLLSYPRTDSRYLSRDVAKGLHAVTATLLPLYPAASPRCTQESLGSRWVQDGKVTDHHAIVPTERNPVGLALSEAERALYDLVCRRLLCAWMDDFVQEQTTVELRVRSECGEFEDRYEARGIVVVDAGFTALAPKRPSAGQCGECSLPAGLRREAAAECIETRVREGKTRPPARFTEATLLTAMESAGRTLDERTLSEAMRERGLGTPATRAAILETLLRRRFLAREGKFVVSTGEGRALVRQVHPAVRSPRLTGEWERRLAQIEAQQACARAFIQEVERSVAEAVAEALAGPQRRA